MRPDVRVTGVSGSGAKSVARSILRAEVADRLVALLCAGNYSAGFLPYC
jgi:hypothetical protein